MKDDAGKVLDAEKFDRRGDSRTSKSGSKNTRNGARGKGKRTSASHSDRTRSSSKDGVAYTKASNPWQWYAKNAEMLNSSANIVYSRSAGVPFSQVGPGAASVYTIDTAETSVTRIESSQDGLNASFPALMVFETIPTPGFSDSAISPLNVAVRDIYSFVRHKNSGSANYDAPDLGLYILGYQSMVSILSHVIRMYGILRLYNYQNRAWPVHMAAALGLKDPEVAQSNLADFAFRINQLIVKLNSLAMPDSLNLYTRSFWMYSNIYSDGDTPKSQNYAFVPAGYFQYNATKYRTGGSLEYISLNEYYLQDGLTYSQWCDRISLMINKYIEDEEMNIMSGDLIKAYKGQVASVPYMDINYVVTPVKEETTNLQIHNLNTVGLPETGMDYESFDMLIDAFPGDDGTWLRTRVSLYRALSEELALDAQEYDYRDIVQSGNILYYMPLFHQPGIQLPHQQILDVWDDAPTPEITIEATRIMARPRLETYVPLANGGTSLMAFYNALPSEPCVTMHIWRMVETESGRVGFQYLPIDDTAAAPFNGNLYTVLGVTQETAVEYTRLLSILAKFDWAPRIYPGTLQDTDAFTVLQPSGDIQTFAFVNRELEPMHETALLSLLDVPVNWAANADK